MSTLIEENSNDLGAVFGEPLKTVVVAIRNSSSFEKLSNKYGFQIVITRTNDRTIPIITKYS